ncbi:hypothetical protein BGZ54_002046 [Gamsiella multidivaricata]|nr:hypothetical protein BGZ54_002046 [Gamsiella multidivaricata]
MEKFEALEGADLRQLESYLKFHDQGRTLGNLYRTVTAEGHVKWVCIDHYRENYQESAVQQLRDVILENSEAFVEQQGKIEITLTSPILAKQLYDGLVKARGVHELEITLNWDAPLDDLRKFIAAVTKANIVHLAMWDQSFKGPTRDYINRNRRFNLIV